MGRWREGGQEIPDGCGKKVVFGCLDALPEVVDSVAGMDRDFGLSQDRAGVDAGIYQMNGASCFGHSGFESLNPGRPARKGGQQRGMDVDNPASEVAQHRIFEPAHKSGADDQGAARRLKSVANGLLGFRAEAVRVPTGVDPCRRDALGARPVEDAGVRVIGQNEPDPRLERAGINGVQENAEV